jgi:hypothetical protein
VIINIYRVTVVNLLVINFNFIFIKNTDAYETKTNTMTLSPQQNYTE